MPVSLFNAGSPVSTDSISSEGRYFIVPIISLDVLASKPYYPHMTKFKHQGDVPIYPFEGKITGEKVEHIGSLTLAYGEATGHHHTIHVPKIEDMDAIKLPDGGWLLTLRAEGVLKHQEHLPIKIAPGKYRIGREREKDWF